MQITRRQGGALAMASLLAARGVRAATPGVLVRSDSPPANLDPHQLFDVPMMGYALNAYDGLYRYENNPPELQPWLAEGHTASADGLEWEFRLRPEVRFHDGAPLTAEDVVYSFRRVLALGKAPASAFLGILKPENVTAPDARTVRFRLERAYGPFLAAIPIVAIVNSRLVRANEKDGDHGAAWLAGNEAGSGAYAFVPGSLTTLERLDMARFEGHFLGWSDNPSPVPRIAVRAAKETSTGVLGLLNGSIDWTDSYLPTDQVEQIQGSRVAQVAKDVSMRTFIIRMNNARAPFTSLNLRKAMAHAFNYDGFIQEILKGYADRNAGPIPNQLWGAPKDAPGYAYDLDKARHFLKLAQAEGFNPRQPIRIHIQSQLEQTNQAAQLFQSDLQSIGVNLRIVADTWANIVSATAKPETSPDMWIHWVSTYFVDPENWVGQMYDSRFHGTWKASSFYRNEKVDALLQRARGLVAQAERAPLYEEATRQVMADCADIWVYNTVELRGLARRLSGYRFCPAGGGAEMRWLQMKG
ncbi:ABC transporter substrate-binding protein [Belnapia rosea]|uniref:ABC transporter substrate-binding protein n=1 Tax=Belnapia rosea TaxID=938405 RepID=UPI000889A720|nr:ABC transporter substrate-binding protein [Belnapia rosea]SDB47410.1 peptide/nickel transport system substrate-binding protein [Belnapia rosea]